MRGGGRSAEGRASQMPCGPVMARGRAGDSHWRDSWTARSLGPEFEGEEQGCRLECGRELWAGGVCVRSTISSLKSKINTMAHYSAIKRNEVLIHITPQINLENVPSERSQTQNAPRCTAPCT